MKRKQELSYGEKIKIQTLRNAAYQGSRLFETLERERYVFGNGHHMRQYVEQYAGANALNMFFPSVAQTLHDRQLQQVATHEYQSAINNIGAAGLDMPKRSRVAQALLSDLSPEPGVLTGDEVNTDILARNINNAMLQHTLDLSDYCVESGHIREKEQGIRVYTYIEGVALFADAMLLGARATTVLFANPPGATDNPS
jgi:hypothetical protein